MKRRPRVLFAVPSAYPVGGLATWLDTLLPDLEGRGWESWLGLSEGRYSNAGDYLALHPFERHVLFRNVTGTGYSKWRSIRKTLLKVQPEVVVVANLVDVNASVAWMRSRGVPTPRIVQAIHTLDPGLFEDLRRGDLAIDWLAAPNRLVAAAAEELSSFPSERISYASYGVDLPELCAPTGVNDRVEVVYAGRFDRAQKRVDRIAGILGRLVAMGVDWSLTVAGAGPEEHSLRESLASFGERVDWQGALPPARLRREQLQPGRVLLLTSRWELGPVVAWEAMAQGVVVVAPHFVGSGLEAALRDEETALLYPAGDAAAAAAQLARLRDPDLRSRIAAAARREAASRYAREVAAKAWDRCLRAALATSARAETAAVEPPLDGRLVTLLGAPWAEAMRRALGRRGEISSSGGEWPHTRGGGLAEESFFARLAAIDGVSSRSGEGT